MSSGSRETTVLSVGRNVRMAPGSRSSVSWNRAVPWLSWNLRHPFFIIAGCLIAGLCLAQYSKSLAIAAAAWVNFYFCLRCERQHLEQLLVPPLVLLGFQHLLSSGFGLPLIWLGLQLHGLGTPEDSEAVWLCQQAHAVSFPLIMIGYSLFRRQSRGFSLGLTPFTEERTLRVLHVVGVFLLINYAVTLAAGLITGSGDRSRLLEFLDRGFGIWSWFRLFPRLNPLFFLLAPLMFRRVSNLSKLVLLLVVGGLLGVNAVSGSRSQLLGPICFLLMGWWMFYPHSARIVRYGIMIGLLAIPYIIFVPFYRSSEKFAATRGTDIISRIEVMAEVFDTVKGSEIGGTLQLTGESLHGLNDREIFRLTPGEIPFAEWEEVSRIKSFWIPSIFAPEKKPLLDGNEIVQRYRPNERIFGAGISFVADSFRRFGWKGIIVGSLVLGGFLGWIYSTYFRLQNTRFHLLATAAVLYSLTYFTSLPYLTWLETVWIWLWETPKHLALIAVLLALASRMVGKSPSVSRGVTVKNATGNSR